ncbi:class I SAM-dependent methyltransferase [bacterium]|nr:class I SAM-dependent methyltransferase [bacterium]
MLRKHEINWGNYDPDLLRNLTATPGGTSLATELIIALEPAPRHHWLDFCPGPEILAPVLAREYGMRVTSLIQDPRCEIRLEDAASKLDVSEFVNVIPGERTSLPVPSEEFDRVFCLGNPFFPKITPEMAAEIHRVLIPDGLVGFAGPASFKNSTPPYMEQALVDYPGMFIKTPAWSALHFSKEGFHIVTAEYIHGTWDLWNEWLKDAPPERIPESFRKAIIEDQGRWLSMGLLILRKPYKPAWAL